MASMNEHPFTRLEAQLQFWIEERLVQFFEGGVKPTTILRRLARILENDHRQYNSIPDILRVQLHPKDYTTLLEAYPQIESQLTAQLTQLATEAHLRLTFPLQIRLYEDETISPAQVKIESEYSLPPEGSTQRVEPIAKPMNDPVVPTNAMLVLQNGDHISLNRSVINVGRQNDNHIVVDDRRVSRLHCQLRLRFGRYVIYDLQSKGGTMVNDARIQEHRLQSGDVISLAGMKIIYLDDEASGEHDTQKHEPPAYTHDTQEIPTFNDGDPTL